MTEAKVYTQTEVHDIYTSYMNANHVDAVDRAFEYANGLHKEQRRRSGEPYIIHPIQVAGILADLHMDPDTVIAGYLHDVVEDTPAELEDIVERFGEDVAAIVDGVSKISKIEYKSDSERLAENHRKLLLAMSHDIRVIFVKLADRLHNIRTLDALNPAKQKRIAGETLEIYAPLADRLGIMTIKWELEDTSLRYLDYEAYHAIAQDMQLRRNERLEIVATAVDEIKVTIDNLKLKNVSVYGRPKHIYSIYRKMQKKQKAFEEIYDLLAIRVIVNSIGDCYAVLGAIHSHWTPMPGRFKDYIALPKANGYQSLHTSVIGPEGRPLEIQIRTHDMHEVAEFGVAAHWAYKEGKFDGADVQNSDQQQLNMIQSILELQTESKDSGDFMETVKSDLFTDRVYAFTPLGDVVELTQGAGPLDMAYSIHTKVGNSTTGAKVNGKIVPLDYEIKTGDIVEIITSAIAKPNRDWLKLVKTRRARNKIRQYFKKQNHSENSIAGKQELMNYLISQGYNLDELMTNKNTEQVMERLHYQSIGDMYAAIGYGDQSVQGVTNKLTEDLRKRMEEQRLSEEEALVFEQHETVAKDEEDHKTKHHHGDDPIVIQGIDSMLVRLGRCCTPVPGDDVVGYITKGRGVSVHRVGCPNLASEAELSQRLVDVKWDEDSDNSKREYVTDLVVTGESRARLLNDVIRMIGNHAQTLNSINGRVDGNNQAIISLTVEVHNLAQLERVMDSIKNVKDVSSVKRAFK
ncbi:RelA/SpoT family protein [Weissella koreensis]|uniref:GTP diphosphokinase n=1 Tax=Weissella koreensis TaxID=165096 RepID=A0A7H1MNA0_9LACO|nr:bifunctional (p)ppGpp synthetase/guanosine-3',5'-bis(diphosphate) 3'-pyrophosphohydrolase [Weissella koreensis]AVH75734.1 GTP pyrophosphokinase [Weissella koreensis]QGN20955.1 RelA/SpoT family protein [Weissella koreensis]QNT64936.1 bifunctional (p)ppGpp synthetase/guanosine-3',5'-bis(diphosphate) 3'-pyrophosphohydrolase [Weissella koreensis]